MTNKVNGQHSIPLGAHYMGTIRTVGVRVASFFIAAGSCRAYVPEILYIAMVMYTHTAVEIPERVVKIRCKSAFHFSHID